MPHQCLQCGHAFEEGSSALLAGCPQCKGTKFFYSAQPVSAEERDELRASAQKDLRQVVAQVLEESNPAVAKELQSRADADGFAELTPRDLRRIVKQIQSEETEQTTAPTRPIRPPSDGRPVDSPKRLQEARKVRDDIIAEFSEPDPDSHPDTVRIDGDGRYDVDVKGLMEKSPIVVEKDGAYMIHLPSLFDQKK